MNLAKSQDAKSIHRNHLHSYVKVKSLSHVRLFAIPWTVVYQTSLSMGFSRQEYWSGVPFPSPGDLPDQGSNRGLLHCRQKLYPLSHQRSPRHPYFSLKGPFGTASSSQHQSLVPLISSTCFSGSHPWEFSGRGRRELKIN